MSRCGVVLGSLALWACAAGAAPLRSPWDGAKINPTEAVYACPEPPPFSRTVVIGSYYIDDRASIADPKLVAAFDKASEASNQLSRSVALAADVYRGTGSRAGAACVYSLLHAAAKAGAWSGKMPSFQGVYLQDWLLSSVAMSYLKVRSAGLGQGGQEAEIQREIQRWFGDLAGRVRTYFEEEIARQGMERENNHLYWAGLAVMASGIARDNRGEFDWGLRAFKSGVQAIQADGSLTAEMARGQMALHYHLYALGPLVMMAELGEANGVAMYAEENGAMHRLVKFCLAGLEDPTLLQKKTGVVQKVTLPYEGSDIGWAVPYVRRFSNAELSALIVKAPWVRYTTWGGAPPD